MPGWTRVALLTAAGQRNWKGQDTCICKPKCNGFGQQKSSSSTGRIRQKRTYTQISVLNVQCEKALRQLVVEIGQIDVLFNCRGSVQYGTILECREDDSDFSFKVNVKSVLSNWSGYTSGDVECRPR